MADITNEVALIQKASRGEEVRDAIVVVFQKLEADQDAMIKKDEEALADGMRMSVYDTDGDGIVDNAKKVDGHTVGADVPSDAKFTDTDTVYDDTDLKQTAADHSQKIADLQTAADKAATKDELAAAKTELEGKIGSGSSASDGTVATVDAALSETSENPVQNKVVATALNGKQDTLAFDSVPTAGSSNPVTSGGVAEAIENAKGLTSAEVQAMIDTSIGSALEKEY